MPTFDLLCGTDRVADRCVPQPGCRAVPASVPLCDDRAAAMRQFRSVSAAPAAPAKRSLSAAALDDLSAAGETREPLPGMPAEPMIMTGERTALDYLLGPLVDSFPRSFRES